MEKRSGEKFVVKIALTERYKRSAIPNMKRLLNNNEKEKMEIFRRIKKAGWVVGGPCDFSVTPSPNWFF